MLLSALREWDARLGYLCALNAEKDFKKFEPIELNWRWFATFMPTVHDVLNRYGIESDLVLTNVKMSSFYLMWKNKTMHMYCYEVDGKAGVQLTVQNGELIQQLVRKISNVRDVRDLLVLIAQPHTRQKTLDEQKEEITRILLDLYCEEEEGSRVESFFEDLKNNPIGWETFAGFVATVPDALKGGGIKSDLTISNVESNRLDLVWEDRNMCMSCCRHETADRVMAQLTRGAGGASPYAAVRSINSVSDLYDLLDFIIKQHTGQAMYAGRNDVIMRILLDKLSYAWNY